MAKSKITVCDAKFTNRKVLMVCFKFNREIINAVKAIDLEHPRNVRYGGDWFVELTAENLPRVKNFIQNFKAVICPPDRAVIRQWMDEIEGSGL